MRGETLSAEEQALYLSGLKELEAEERYPGQEETLKRLREEIQVALAENAVLDQRRHELQAEIDAAPFAKTNG